jgi:hypothetical protein
VRAAEFVISSPEPPRDTACPPTLLVRVRRLLSTPTCLRYATCAACSAPRRARLRFPTAVRCGGRVLRCGNLAEAKRGCGACRKRPGRWAVGAPGYAAYRSRHPPPPGRNTQGNKLLWMEENTTKMTCLYPTPAYVGAAGTDASCVDGHG